MGSIQAQSWSRREIVVGLAIGAAVGLAAGAAPGALAASMHDPAREAVRRLMRLAARRAFASLGKPDGFWASSVARIPLPGLFNPSGVWPGPLAKPAFRDDLQHRLNVVAQAAARIVAPRAAHASLSAAVPDPGAVLRGTPTSATSLLRAELGPRSINALIPAMAQALRRADDPVIASATRALRHVTQADVAHALANGADSAIWYQVGAEEAAIRRDPDGAGDPSLATALRMP